MTKRFFALSAFAFGLGIAAATPIDEMEPSANVNGTLGLGQIVSAEAMGQGRFTVTARGNLYQQVLEFPGGPKKDAQITTGTLGLGFGVNPYVDAFAGVAMYNLSGSDPDNGAGLGTVTGGFQGSIPFSDKIPGRVGFQLAVLAGTASNQINNNYADGYNYFETRKGTDFSFKLTQTIVFKSLLSFRLHFNEGLVTSLQNDKSALLLQGAGIEFAPAPSFVLGTEFHSRTVLKDNRDSDPMWFVPSVEFRSAANHLNAQFGTELSLIQERKDALDRSLEPWRVFGAVTWSFNPNPGRNLDAEKARQDSLSRAALVEQARRSQALADSLARKSREDSLMRAGSDDAARRRADSLAARARQDSLALAEARRNLDAERNRRTDWEKEFLKTGLLNLEALYFETGRAEISINSKAYLNLVGRMLSKYPKLQMEIAGHTDNVGGAAKNEKLSQDRADAVRLYLSAAYAELSGHLSAKGYGSAVPKTTNATAEGRQINRRVEIAVLNKEVLKEYE
ncbi:MAG: Photosystem chlorophyll a apoprotein [Fibrobacteres bacterium]|nr:Photosystem chlorophyll a apoprotein [Fibrobacterota bacterium]